MVPPFSMQTSLEIPNILIFIRYSITFTPISKFKFKSFFLEWSNWAEEPSSKETMACKVCCAIIANKSLRNHTTKYSRFDYKSFKAISFCMYFDIVFCFNFTFIFILEIKINTFYWYIAKKGHHIYINIDPFAKLHYKRVAAVLLCIILPSFWPFVCLSICMPDCLIDLIVCLNVCHFLYFI